MDINKQIESAIDEARSGSSLIAMIELEDLVRSTGRPDIMGWLGYCLAKEKQDYSRALILCTTAIETTPDNPDLYLALGRVYLLAGRRYQALSTLRKGLKMGRHEMIVQELNEMGLRKQPIFHFLERSNPLNVMVSRVMNSLGIR